MKTNTVTLYRKITDHIIGKISSGEYKPYQSIPNERELSEIFNVSRITSKRALDELKRSGYIYRIIGSGSYVAPKNTGDIFSEDNYKFHVKSNHTIVALIMPIDPIESGMINTIESINEVLYKNDIFLTVHNSYNNSDRERSLLLELPKQSVKGIILYSIDSVSNMDIVHGMLMNRYPLVSIDRYFNGVSEHYVESDNLTGAYNLTKMLIEKGHTRICFMSNIKISNCTSVKNRYLGYCNALHDYNIPTDSKLLVCNYQLPRKSNLQAIDDVNDNIFTSLKKLNVTAIQAVNDEEAVLIQRACLNSGHKVPDDFSITGFDGLDYTKMMDVPITTAKQDFYQIGVIAAEKIHALLNGKSIESVQDKVPVKIIERQSTGYNN